MGSASRVWLHYSLKSLNKSLDDNLLFLSGDPLKLIPELIKLTGANSVYWNRCYEPWRITRDKKLKENLSNIHIEVKSFNSSLLWEPWTVTKLDGSPYKVFSPFYKKGCLSRENEIRDLYPIAKSISFISKPSYKEIKKLDDLSLLPNKVWHRNIIKNWEIGEIGAQNKLKKIVSKKTKRLQERTRFSITSDYFRAISSYPFW